VQLLDITLFVAKVDVVKDYNSISIGLVEFFQDNLKHVRVIDENQRVSFPDLVLLQPEL
jgi:hypothetical protein